MEPGDLRFPINLATALRLADARPLIVAAAQASAWSAEGQLQKAKVLWIPSFMVASSYLRHDGPVDFNQGINVPQGTNIYGQPAPSSFGKPLNQNVNWFIAGVSLYQVVATTDIIFQPLSARQNVNAKRLGHPDREERRRFGGRPVLFQYPPLSRTVRRSALHRWRRAKTACSG